MWSRGDDTTGKAESMHYDGLVQERENQGRRGRKRNRDRVK